MDANLARHFLAQFFFGNYAKIHVFTALSWLVAYLEQTLCFKILIFTKNKRYTNSMVFPLSENFGWP